MLEFLNQIDWHAIAPFIAIGFAAQLVDGALGMAFGVICSTLLVSVMGVPPSRASAGVHLVEMFTTGASGISHVLHKNVDWKLFAKIALPGVIGGVLVEQARVDVADLARVVVAKEVVQCAQGPGQVVLFERIHHVDVFACMGVCQCQLAPAGTMPGRPGQVRQCRHGRQPCAVAQETAAPGCRVCLHAVVQLATGGGRASARSAASRARSCR